MYFKLSSYQAIFLAKDIIRSYVLNLGTIKFKIGKGVCQGCKILSPCLFKFYAEYFMQSARLDASQDGVKIAQGNINNLRYADDSTLMAESKEELKSLLMRMKEDSDTTGLNSTFKKLRSWHLVPSLHGK